MERGYPPFGKEAEKKLFPVILFEGFPYTTGKFPKYSALFLFATLLSPPQVGNFCITDTVKC